MPVCYYRLNRILFLIWDKRCLFLNVVLSEGKVLLLSMTKTKYVVFSVCFFYIFFSVDSNFNLFDNLYRGQWGGHAVSYMFGLSRFHALSLMFLRKLNHRWFVEINKDTGVPNAVYKSKVSGFQCWLGKG